MIYIKDSFKWDIWAHITDGSIDTVNDECIADQLYARMLGWTE